VQRQPSRVTALQYFIGCMMPESANALQANAAIIEMIALVFRFTDRHMAPDCVRIYQQLLSRSSTQAAA